MSPIDRVVAALEARGLNPRPSGSGFSARCPAHDDRSPSLEVKEGEDGKALIKCHAGCPTDSVVAALEMRMADLFPERPREPARPRRIAATYPYTDETGELISEAVRYEPKGFGQRRPDGAGGYVWNLNGEPRRVPYRLPEVRATASAGGTIYVAEGEKDVDALAALGLTATCNAMGAGNWRADHAEQLRGASRVIIVADKDEPGRAHAKQVAVSLAGIVPDVRVIEVPIGKDASDWIAAGGTREALEKLAESAPQFADAPTIDAPERPEFVILKGHGHEAVAAAVAALARHPTTFQRGGRLVTVAEWEGAPAVRREIGAPVVRDMTGPLVWERLSGLVGWNRLDSRGKQTACDPPSHVVQAVHQRGEYPGVRELRGVIGSPALRPDGTIIDAPGYDSETGLLFVPAGRCDPIPEHPTREDALAARDALLDVVCDFPFEQPAHRAAWFAGLITPIVRPALDGSNVPLFLVDANSRGAGKGMLVHAAAIVATGRTAPCESFTLDAAELDKRIVAHLQAADAIVNFDNVAGDFGGPVLDKLLTTEGLYGARRLGSNDASAALKLPNLATWWATLNNAALTGDAVRRLIHVRLATELEHPEERQGFRHPDLLAWVRQERPRLLAAALTVARAWFVAGRPHACEVSAFGSFERWSSVVRAICQWLDLPDPWRDTVGGLRRADQADDLHGALLAGLGQLDPEGRGLSTGEIKRIVESPGDETTHNLADALAAAGLLVDGKVQGQKLGKRLRSYRAKRKAGEWIEEAGRDSRNGTARWAVVRAGSLRETGS